MDVLGPSHPVSFLPGTLLRTRHRPFTSPSPAHRNVAQLPSSWGELWVAELSGLQGFKISGKLLCEGPRVDPLRKKGQPFPASWVPKLRRISSLAEVRGHIPHLQQFPMPHFLFFFPPFSIHLLAVAVICFTNIPSIPLSFPSPCWQLCRHLIAIQTPVTSGCHCGCCHAD